MHGGVCFTKGTDTLSWHTHCGSVLLPFRGSVMTSLEKDTVSSPSASSPAVSCSRSIWNFLRPGHSRANCWFSAAFSSPDIRSGVTGMVRKWKSFRNSHAVSQPGLQEADAAGWSQPTSPCGSHPSRYLTRQKMAIWRALQLYSKPQI